MTRIFPRWLVLLVAAGACLRPGVATAQLNGFNIKGDQGLNAGTQAPAGVYLGATLDWYGADTIKDREGRAISNAGEVGLFLGGPLLNVVTKKTLLGGTYGFMTALPFANARLELPRTDENPGPGVSDLYVQPINLGWHTKRADVLAGYGLFVPRALHRWRRRQHRSRHVGSRSVRGHHGVPRCRSSWLPWRRRRCTCPTNALSALRLLSPMHDGIPEDGMTVSWQSVAGVSYFLERSTNLAAPPCFTPLATGIPGQPGTTSYTDTNAVGRGLFFYRVGPQAP